MATPNSYKDEYYDTLDRQAERKVGLTPGLLSSIRLHGEKSNADQVSSAGAKSVYQIIPATRNAVLKKYGVDAYLSPENAALASAHILKESRDRNAGSNSAAVREYVGGTNENNWGPVVKAYVNRVMTNMQRMSPIGTAQADDNPEALQAEYDAWLANQAGGQEQQTSQADAEQPEDLQAEYDAWLANQGQEEAPVEEEPSQDLVSKIGRAAANLPETITGSKRKTQETESLPSYYDMPEMNLWGSGMTGVGTTLATDPNEDIKILQAKYPDIGVREDEKGNKILKSPSDGKEYAIKPGLEFGDVPGIAANMVGFKGAPIGSLFTGGVKAIGKKLATEAAKQAAVVGGSEALQEQAGGDFNTENVQLAAVAPAVLGGVAQAGKKAAQIAGRIRPRLGLSDAQHAAAAGANSGARSVGSAATSRDAMTDQLGQDFPVPFTGNAAMTRGQRTRDFAYSQAEREDAKNAELGGPLRDRFENQTEVMGQNMEAFIDESGMKTSSLYDTGTFIGNVINKFAEKAKNKTRAAYKKADLSAEGDALVSYDDLVKTINDSQSLIGTTPILDVAKKEIIRQGGAIENDGVLTALPIPLKKSATLRTVIGNGTGYEPTNQRMSSILKNSIDNTNEGAGGDLYKKARGLHRSYVKQFKNMPVVADLLNSKRGTDARKVAFEDVYKRIMKNSSQDDVKFVKDLLENNGKTGKQAWKELKGQALIEIRDKMQRGTATDSRGNKVISVAGLDSIITDLDKTGKLDVFFTGEQARQLRDLSELSKTLMTSPPNSVNTSNTASIITAAVDLATSAITGIPAPAATITKLLLNKHRNRLIEQRVTDALTK
jgi:hypothetical protein